MKTSQKALLTAISKSVKHVSVFLLSILLARYLTLDEYGTYIQVMLIANTAIYFFLLGIPSSVYFFLIRAHNKKQFLLRTIAIIHLLALLAAFIGYQGSDQLASLLNNERLADFAFIYVLFILFQIPIKLFEPIMISSDRVKEFIWINLSFNALFFFAIAIPLVLYEDISLIFTWMAVFFAAQYLVIYVSIARSYFALVEAFEQEGKPEHVTLLSQLKYSIPIGTSGAISEVAHIVDRIIISGYFNPAQLAIFNRGAMEIPMLNVVINSLGNILMPKFVQAYADNRPDQIIGYWHSSVIIIAFAVYPTMAYLIATADLLIPLLFSEKFLPSVIIFQVYSLVFLTRITTYDAIIRAVGKTVSLLRVTILSIVLNVALTVLLIEMIGMVGAVVATVIVAFIIRAELLRIIKNLLGIRFVDVFPWIDLLKILAFAILATIPVLLYRHLSPVTGYVVNFILCGLLYAVTFLLLNRLHSLLGSKEISALRGVLPPRLVALIAPR